jgi:hypothetical protein
VNKISPELWGNVISDFLEKTHYLLATNVALVSDFPCTFNMSALYLVPKFIVVTVAHDI